MKTLRWIVGFILLAAVAAAIIYLPGSGEEDTTPQPQSVTMDTSAPVEEQEEIEPAAIITYTDDGFSQSQTSVAAGSAVLIRNNASIDLQFSSDQHPVHTENTELNAQAIQPGESTTIIVQTPGTWGFHNHVMETHSGSLVVE